MKKIPTTENAVIVRTDFSNPGAWDELVELAREPADPFMFNMEFLEVQGNDGANVEDLLGALPEDYPHSFIVVADDGAMAEPDYPLLVVDLLEERGRHFRCAAEQVASVENNLSTGNMGFEEFAGVAEESGIFRGFPEEE